MMPSPQGFNFRHALSELAAYQAEHPDFAAGVGIWMAVGTILLVFGMIIFLFSEIKAVLVCRDQVCEKRHLAICPPLLALSFSSSSHPASIPRNPRTTSD
jgi:hypothetical protein